jgi:hypothetical protein
MTPAWGDEHFDRRRQSRIFHAGALGRCRSPYRCDERRLSQSSLHRPLTESGDASAHTVQQLCRLSVVTDSMLHLASRTRRGVRPEHLVALRRASLAGRNADGMRAVPEPDVVTT